MKMPVLYLLGNSFPLSQLPTYVSVLNSPANWGDILTRSLINELNEVKNMRSLYVCIKIIILKNLSFNSFRYLSCA